MSLKLIRKWNIPDIPIVLSCIRLHCGSMVIIDSISVRSSLLCITDGMANQICCLDRSPARSWMWGLGQSFQKNVESLLFILRLKEPLLWLVSKFQCEKVSSYMHFFLFLSIQSTVHRRLQLKAKIKNKINEVAQLVTRVDQFIA